MEETSETKVANVKVSHIRPRYQNLRNWMSDSDNVYIGRAGIVFIDGERFPKQSSIFANPFKIGKDISLEEVLARYETYIVLKIETNPVYKQELI